MAFEEPTQDEQQPETNELGQTPEEALKQRRLIGRRIKSVHKFIQKKFKDETKVYLSVLRHEFGKLLPEKLLRMDDVDVNIMFPIIKTVIPSLYFQDPKVMAKSDQEKIISPVFNPETGEQEVDQLSGQPMQEEFDGPIAAKIFAGALNQNIREADLKNEEKMALVDAQVGFYGAIKCGWGNDQGVKTMGDGAPPSTRVTLPDMAYGIRLKPWEVLVDMNDFNHPEWIAVRYCVHPDQLKKDPRFKNTEKLEGKVSTDTEKDREIWSAMDEEDKKKVEYFEYYHLPCAQYPEGVYAVVCEEVPDDYLFIGPWPYEAIEFPIKLIFFNPDPEGGLPTPYARYYIAQQRVKSTLRRVAYEYVQRTLPFVAYDQGKMDTQGKQKLSSGQIPRTIPVNGNPDAAINPKSFNNLNPDFYRFDAQVDADVNRMMGILKAGELDNIDLASVAKIADVGEKIRISEMADISKDHLRSIIKFWAKLYQQFGSEENYTPLEGEKFPVKWTVKQIQGKFSFDIQPFSMNFEDPVISRRQDIDLLNILIAPPLQQALAAQGISVDYAKRIKALLRKYNDPEIEDSLITEMEKPENQVADAVQENQEIQAALMQGIPPSNVVVEPTDNHKLHIIIHGLIGDAGLEHMTAHQQALQTGIVGQAGGGNPEGLPTNGSAGNQDMLAAPLNPSIANQKNALRREAKKPVKTR